MNRHQLTVPEAAGQSSASSLQPHHAPLPRGYDTVVGVAGAEGSAARDAELSSRHLD